MRRERGEDALLENECFSRCPRFQGDCDTLLSQPTEARIGYAVHLR